MDIRTPFMPISFSQAQKIIGKEWAFKRREREKPWCKIKFYCNFAEKCKI